MKLLFRFAGKTDDEVRGQGNVGAGGAEAFHKRHVAGHVVLAVHAGQHAIRSGLERQVQARAEVRNFPEHGDDLWGEIFRMRSHETQPGEPGQFRHLTQQACERRVAGSVLIEAVGVHILAEQGDFLRAVVDERPAFVKDGSGVAGFLTAPREGDDAVGAEVVTALHDVDEGHWRDLAFTLRGQGGIAFGVDFGKVGEVQAQGRISMQPFDGVGSHGEPVAAHDQPYLRETLKEARADLLGHASRDHGKRAGHAAGFIFDAPKRGIDFLFRFVAHRAGVEDFRLFKGRFDEPPALQGSGEPKRVVDVHLAAKRDDMESALRHREMLHVSR